MDRYIKIKLLFGKDENNRECICRFNNPNCQYGYNGKCEKVDCIVDRFSERDIQECFENKILNNSISDT